MACEEEQGTLEPPVGTHVPDPNTIEALGGERENEEDRDLSGDEEEQLELGLADPVPEVRRSGRSKAGQTSRFDDFVRNDGNPSQKN
jgi:hypothetical protein